jgi:hypothetical protein
MDDDALRQWELYFGEHNECTSIHVYNNVNYYIFDMILFFNHTLQQYLIQNDTNSILDLLDTFSSIVKQSVDHNIIGAKICFSTGDLSRADYFMKQAFSLDPLNPGLMQLYRDIKKPFPDR